MTYAAPVTRRMLHFNNLDYYTIPALPAGWEAPRWLKVQLGMFAGRLYFDWEEYEYLADFFGLDEEGIDVEDEEDGNNTEELQSQTDGADERREADREVAPREPKKLFVKKPLTFMQEWLAVRRRGQDVANTPLGFITQGKPLSGDHPFFRQEDTEERAALRGITARIVPDKKEAEEITYEGGIDVPVSDMDSSSEGDSDIEYNDDELYSNEEEGDDEGSPEQQNSSDDAGRGRAARRSGANPVPSGARGGRGRRQR